MLTQQETERLIERYGTTIREVSGQVSEEFHAGAGKLGHGWNIVEAAEVEQETYTQLIESGTTATMLDLKESAEAYIRTTARYYGAFNQARSRRRDQLVDIREHDGSHGVRTGGLGAVIATRADFHGSVRSPEALLMETALIEAIETGVLAIIEALRSPLQRTAMRLFYLGGLSSKEIATEVDLPHHAIRKALQRGRETVGEDDASLRVWRSFVYPEARKPQGEVGAAEALKVIARRFS